jgi:MFS family permease
MSQALKYQQELPSLKSSGRFRWIICGLLFFATTINYMDRQILSLLKPILDNQMGWTNEQFGAINSAFQGAYAIGGLLFGWLVDRIGSKIGYTLSITGWSLAAIGHSLASSVGGFFVARACLGITEAGNFPTSIKTVALWFPKKERAFAISLFNSGANVVPILFTTSVGDWMAVFLIGLAGSAHQAWSANLYSTASDMFPKNAVASLIGIGSAAGSTGGIIFPIVTGQLLDRFQASGNVTAGYSILFVICAFAYLVAFGLNHLCAPKFEPTASFPNS